MQEVAADDKGVGGRDHGVGPAGRDEQRLSWPQLVSRATLRAPSKEAASLRQARRMVKSCSRASPNPTTGTEGSNHLLCEDLRRPECWHQISTASRSPKQHMVHRPD